MRRKTKWYARCLTRVKVKVKLTRSRKGIKYLAIIGWCWVSYQKLGRTRRVLWRPTAEADKTFRDLILHIVQKPNNGVLFSQNISNFKPCVPRSTLKVPISIGLLFGKHRIAKGCLHYQICIKRRRVFAILVMLLGWQQFGYFFFD